MLEFCTEDRVGMKYIPNTSPEEAENTEMKYNKNEDLAKSNSYDTIAILEGQDWGFRVNSVKCWAHF